MKIKLYILVLVCVFAAGILGGLLYSQFFFSYNSFNNNNIIEKESISKDNKILSEDTNSLIGKSIDEYMEFLKLYDSSVSFEEWEEKDRSESTKFILNILPPINELGKNNLSPEVKRKIDKLYGRLNDLSSSEDYQIKNEGDYD